LLQISLLKRAKSGGFGSAGDIVATVEETAGVVSLVKAKRMVVDYCVALG
jgi:hypothetical protein